MTQSEIVQSPSTEAAELVSLYEQMVLLRKFDERVGDLFRRAKLPGFVHLYIGEEAIATGVCAALRPTTTSQAHTVAMGITSPRAAT